ncbi:MAG TPA: DivIVA domain-containing protein [Candidatus Krumholzibacteria bacterium]|nr:DivIVA domain-containing protein [Candidatus Krumholzibacteria bacterium]
MRITPLDVRKQEFRRIMRGLDSDEVYAFLATVADEYEAVLNDNKALRERLLELDDKVQEYRSIERTLRDTLLTAERVTVESKDNARREANLIVKEAQLEAEKALRDITSEAARLRQEVQRLRSQRDSYLAKMKVVAESHVKFIESAERDFRAEDDATPEEPRRAPARPAPPAPRPKTLFEKPHAAAPAPRPAPAPDPTDSDGDQIAGIGDILERLSQSQRETLSPQPLETEATFTPEHTPASIPPRSPEPVVSAEPTDSEWNIEQIRRDLQRLAASTRPPDGPNAS